MSKKIVSLHAAEKYAERIMGITPPEGKIFSPEKINGIQSLILRILTECYPDAFKIETGTFMCKDYDCQICMQDGIITTVKRAYCDESSKFSGGIMKSGNKRKKRKISEIGPREKTEKRQRNKFWEQDF